MSVDLGDLVDSLKREVAPPGDFIALFPSSTDDIMTGYLSDAFWEARMEGLTALNPYTELDAIVSPVSPGGDELSRELQQLLVFFAGYRMILAVLRNKNTQFRSKAGPVEFETSVSASTLKEILLALKEKWKILLIRMSDLGTVPSYYIDAVEARYDAIVFHDTYWVR